MGISRINHKNTQREKLIQFILISSRKDKKKPIRNNSYVTVGYSWSSLMQSHYI